MGDLEALERIAASFPSRERFLSELALDPPDATSDEAGPPLRDEDYLILSTIHSAKGQEWRSVFVLNCVDGCIPSDLATGSSEEIEEERRLLYVAMTRAKDELALVVPQRFYVHGQPKYGDRSVFASRTRLLPAGAAETFRPPDLARSRARAKPAGRGGPTRRSQGAHAGDVAVMPTISAFYGIVIQMFWSDHPPPHFHALYAEHEAVVDIWTLEVVEGALPRRAMGPHARMGARVSGRTYGGLGLMQPQPVAEEEIQPLP